MQAFYDNGLWQIRDQTGWVVEVGGPQDEVHLKGPPVALSVCGTAHPLDPSLTNVVGTYFLKRRSATEP